MAEYYFSSRIDSNTTLCIAPLTERRAGMVVEEIDDTSGYFLYQMRTAGQQSEIEVLARITSEEAAFRLRRLLALE
jgi:hypothetical protein